MKKTLLGISLMALSLAAAVPMAAYAVPHDAPPRDGKAVRPPLPPLSEEQIAQARSLAKEYREAVSPLREQLREKKMELKALSPNPRKKPSGKRWTRRAFPVPWVRGMNGPAQVRIPASAGRMVPVPTAGGVLTDTAPHTEVAGKPAVLL